MSHANEGRPSSLTLHWQVTGRRRHAAAGAVGAPAPGDVGDRDLELHQLLQVVEQYEELVSHWRRGAAQPDARGRVVVHGGEPLLRPDIFRLLEALARKRDTLELALVTDGVAVDASVARKIAAVGPSFVQISLDGVRTTHDGRHGIGSFDARVTALRHLQGRGVPLVVAFGAAPHNYHELAAVVRIARGLRVARVWADLGGPVFDGPTPQRDAVLSAEQNRELCQAIATEQGSQRNGNIEIVAHRCLHFLDQRFELDACGAGDTRIAISAGGDLFPCDRLAARVGNVLQQPLTEMYGRSAILLALRDPHRVADGCEGCADEPSCRGGLKCLSYTLMGNPFAADPCCWLARRLPLLRAKTCG